MAERRVLVEVKLKRGAPPDAAIAKAREWKRLGFVVDQTYRAVPMGGGDDPHVTVILRGTLAANANVDHLKQQPDVVGVWDDAPIAPTGLVA